MSLKKRPGRLNYPSRFLLALAILFAGIATSPSSSMASSTEYPGGHAGSFANSGGGWQSTGEYSGLCIQSVTCPKVTGSYESAGGEQGDGDGHIRTTAGPTTLAALLSGSDHKWHSPQFTYNGIGGQTPASLSLNLSRRSGFSSLLSLGGTVEYSVTALNRSGGADRVLIEPTPVGNTDTWAKVPEASVIPGSMKVGDDYVLEIKTSIGGLATVLPGGHVDYDNVVLTAADRFGSGPGNGPGGGGPGTGAAGPVLPPPKVIPAGIAYLYKNRLFIRVKCPKRFKPRCRVNAVALTRKKRGKVMTKNIRATVRKGKFIRKGLQVKPKFRARVRKLAKVRKKTVVVRLKIRSKGGKKKGTTFNRLRVIERRK